MLEIFKRVFKKKKARFKLRISVTHTPPNGGETETIETIYEGETGMALNSIRRAITALMAWVLTENGIEINGSRVKDWTEVEKEKKGWTEPGY